MYDMTHHIIRFVSRDSFISFIDMCDMTYVTNGCVRDIKNAFLDGYCSTVQVLLDWFEVVLGFPELFLLRLHEWMCEGYQKCMCVAYIT